MIDVVFAQANGRVPLPSGNVASVHKGQHWPKTDQVVKIAPGLFTEDPRYGLIYSEAPPGYDGELNELETRVAPDVEDASAAPDAEEATANPGERRSVRRRRVHADESTDPAAE